MPISPTGLAGANSNGKRPINTISNGADDVEELASSGKPRQQDFPPKVHERSGYVWEREEDAPGYIWLNKKAQDEYHRAAEALVHREFMVGRRYGDPFEMADKERAMNNSLKQK